MIWKIIRNKVILIRPASGLGNQLFLYCAGLHVAGNTNKELIIDVSRLKSSDVSHGGTLESFKLTGNFVSLSILGRAFDYVFPRIFRFRFLRNLLGMFIANDVGYQKDLVLKQNKLRYIEGFFMCDKYVNDLRAKGLLNRLELKNPSREYLSLLEEAFVGPTMLVHVRRGDFLANPSSWGILSEDYYLNAMNLISLKDKRNFKILVISDNIDLVRAEFKNPIWQDSYFLDTSLNDPAEIISLFSYADALIIGNSTFSWWGSFYNEGSLIIGPKPFYKSSPDFSDLDRDDITFIQSTWRE